MHLQVSGDEGLQELRKVAVSFEEKIYATATSQVCCIFYLLMFFIFVVFAFAQCNEDFTGVIMSRWKYLLNK